VLGAADGGVFAYGTTFEGSMGGQHLNAPVVGIATAGRGWPDCRWSTSVSTTTPRPGVC
jgi:hypothetical protein